jgi:hypothetical protein
MNTLIRAGAFGALGFAAFRAIRVLRNQHARARTVADVTAVSAWEGEGGNLAPTGSAPRTAGSLSEKGEAVTTTNPLKDAP